MRTNSDSQKGAASMQQEIDSLIASINDDPDKLHSDYTPAAHRLIELGEPALAPALDLMLSDDRITRMRAQRVIEGVTMRLHGFQFGQGWKDNNDELEWRRLWQSLGDLDFDAPVESRTESVELWRRWLADRS
jgi:hypothetical protein